MSKKLSTRVTLLRRLVGSGWGASAKRQHIATLSLVYTTAKYCAPVWCRSAHTCLNNTFLNDALRIVTGSLRPTPRAHLLILSGIQPAELCRMGPILAFAHRGSLDLDHILYGLLSGSSDARQVRLRKAKKAVAMAKRRAYDNLYARLETKKGEKELYRLARQRDRAGKDGQHVRVIKDENGNVMVNLEAVLKRWKKYFEKLMNEENNRDPRTEELEVVNEENEIASVEKK